MAITFKNCGAFGNGGDGFRVSGDIDVDFDGCRSEGNGGQGFNVLPKGPLMDQMGLPQDTDPLRLALALRELQAIPKDRQQAEAEKKGLGRILFGALKDAPDYMLKVIQIANSPQAQYIIQMLTT